MKMKKILAVVMAVLMIAVCFAGCGENKEKTDKNAEIVVYFSDITNSFALNFHFHYGIIFPSRMKGR